MALAPRDVLAGALLVNALPHAVVGLAGKRHLTPLGGEDSSPATNLLWAAMNASGAAALLASSGGRPANGRRAAQRLVSLQVGGLAMLFCGTASELTLGRRRRAARTELERDRNRPASEQCGASPAGALPRCP